MEEIGKILSDLNLSSVDIKIYFYLEKKGPQSANELNETLKLSRRKIYQSLKKLQNKKLISSIKGKNEVFSAIAFEKLLELLVKNKIEQAKIIEQTRKNLVESWKLVDYKEKSKRKSN